ncbi:hypothetical protein G6F37_006638 [Rhizopus arrhizus]|nr:hypothetical protein G6F38_006734 [Rhizopus arrhizus]KAG1157512.1 hypothetical protein G6F37_006638 [Rhizopus arrhizus]
MQTKVVLSLALATALIQAQTFASGTADNSVSAINAQASVAPILNDIAGKNAPELSSEEKLKASVYEDDDEHEHDGQSDDEHEGDGQSENDEHEDDDQTEDDNEEKEDDGENDNDKAEIKKIIANIKKNSYPPKAFKIYKLNEGAEAGRINKKATEIDKRREGTFDDYRGRDKFDHYKKKKDKAGKGYDRNKKEKEDAYQEVNEVEQEVNKEFNEAINEAFNEENNGSINENINESINEEANEESNVEVNEEVNEEASEDFYGERRKHRKEDDDDVKGKEDDNDDEDIKEEDDKDDDAETTEKENDDEKKVDDEDEKEKDDDDSDDDSYDKHRHTDDSDDVNEDEDDSYNGSGGYHHDSYENKKGSKEVKDNDFAQQDAQVVSDAASVGSAISTFAMSDSSPSVSSGSPMSFVGSPSAPLVNATPSGAGSSKVTNNVKAKPTKSGASLMRVSLGVTIGISLIAVSILF